MNGINAGIKFVEFLYHRAAQTGDGSLLGWAQDCETLVRMLSYDEAEANQVKL